MTAKAFIESDIKTKQEQNTITLHKYQGPTAEKAILQKLNQSV
jgi:hypothetical protein